MIFFADKLLCIVKYSDVEEELEEDVAGTSSPRCRSDPPGDHGTLGLHGRHGDVLAPAPQRRAFDEGWPRTVAVGRRGGAGSAGRPRGAFRAKPPGTLGRGGGRWRHRVGRRLWLGGPRQTFAGLTAYALPHRKCLNGAHLSRGG